jgi:triosephosphate isomerase
MHGSGAMVQELLEGLLAGTGNASDVDMAVFPPYPYLAQAQSLLDGSSISWGAQSLNPVAHGAHTGEVSAGMLLDFGCRYVLVGHSERRAIYGESDEDVAIRFEAALAAGLEPVLCVGETLQERESGATEAVVERQLDAVLNRCGVAGFERAIVAYEPVWAIGTGMTATPEQAQAVHAFIRDKFFSQDDIIAGQLRILYGGSVNGSNAADLFAREDIDGGLVGGASLKVEGFLAIRNAVA